MNFKTQVCTTKEQSEWLLALGLKKETADMYLTRCFVGYNGTPMIFVGTTYKPSTVLFSKEDIPAWSLHRLIAMYCSGLISCQYGLVGLGYEGLIGHIEAAIKTGKFNEDYLNKQP